MKQSKNVEVKWLIKKNLGLVVYATCPLISKIVTLKQHLRYTGGIITVSEECHPTQKELIELERSNIKWIHVPIDLLEVPRNVDLTLKVTEFIDEINNDNKAVFIMCTRDCFLGKVLAMAYFLTKGFPFERASELILSGNDLAKVKSEKKFFKYLKFMETFTQKQLAH